ncbi:hypothetical protein SNOG_01703 [Parastagonospora nodorum SN15]|uniref:Uncharacterized protein n=1 Tax=Phaeosphaeria nodorum (strain SN15 / ATCC MYA-4574 / FGSC 10173) TaxID=321614 RepID=Q0V2R1_PHANO|nr:hypothetical protein SNOG_01703 [Parastagonospora nodorum SN15]EAT91352.1 hypothetical protein SNOG_01703 [Parastagonospora nodorum SN15]
MLSQLTSPLSLSLLLLPLSSAAPLSSSERSLNFPPTPATNTCTAGTGTPGAFYMCPDANFGSSSKIPCQTQASLIWTGYRWRVRFLQRGKL